MANVWFTSDLHLGHKNIANFRTQFESELHHRGVIKENYHKVVTKRDKVFFLGDVAFTQETLEDVGSWIAEKKVLIVGNHCTDQVSMKEVVKHYGEVEKTWRGGKYEYRIVPVEVGKPLDTEKVELHMECF